jgi:hypothetical protein
VEETHRITKTRLKGQERNTRQVILGEIMIEPELDKLLKRKVPDDLHLIRELGNEIDSWRATVGFSLVREKKKLIEEENRYQMIKSPRITEMDRKHHVEFHTKEQKLIVDELEIALKVINDRMSWIQSSLKTETEAYKRT